MLKTKVTCNQFFSMLYLSILSSIFMYISTPKVQISGVSSLFMPTIFMALSFVGFLPSYFVIRECRRSEFDINSFNNNKTFKYLSGAYSLIYFIGALNTAARFDLFASSELFSGSDMTFFIVSIVIICSILALLGLGSLSRASAIFTFMVVVATAFVMLSLRKEIDILNFTPDFNKSFFDFLSDGIMFSVQGAEIGTIIIFASQITGNIRRHFVWWNVLSALSFTLLIFFVTGSLGDFANTQIFPTYTAVSIASMGLLERMDALETAIWVLCVVEKISFYILITVSSLKYIFNKTSEKVISIIIGAVLGAILIIISGNVENFAFFSNMPFIYLIYIVAVFILPLIIYFLIRKISYDKKTN